MFLGKPVHGFVEFAEFDPVELRGRNDEFFLDDLVRNGFVARSRFYEAVDIKVVKNGVEVRAGIPHTAPGAHLLDSPAQRLLYEFVGIGRISRKRHRVSSKSRYVRRNVMSAVFHGSAPTHSPLFPTPGKRIPHEPAGDIPEPSKTRWARHGL